MQVHTVAVAREGDIAAVSVHARCRQHMGAIHGHTLRFVDRRGIAVVDAIVVLQVERHIAAVIGAHGHALGVDLLDGPERAVLHAKPALVSQEHHAVARCEVPGTAFGGDIHVVAKVSGFTHPPTRHLV